MQVQQPIRWLILILTSKLSTTFEYSTQNLAPGTPELTDGSDIEFIDLDGRHTFKIDKARHTFKIELDFKIQRFQPPRPLSNTTSTIFTRATASTISAMVHLKSIKLDFKCMSSNSIYFMVAQSCHTHDSGLLPHALFPFCYSIHLHSVFTLLLPYSTHLFNSIIISFNFYVSLIFITSIHYLNLTYVCAFI